ncbi:MAG: hypothetical protein U0795_26330 [Pirellulales bacterium]
MIVRFVGNCDSICQIGRELAASSADGSFSANDLASRMARATTELCDELGDLEQKDWVCRADDDSPKTITAATRWWVREYNHLTVGRQYEVLAYTVDSYRILDDANEPVLYHESLFLVVDPRFPGFWVHEHGPAGELHRGPQEWMVPGYWERYHDGSREIIESFQKVLADLYPQTAMERRSTRQ